jgi:hypothetical protein
VENLVRLQKRRIGQIKLLHVEKILGGVTRPKIFGDPRRQALNQLFPIAGPALSLLLLLNNLPAHQPVGDDLGRVD